jgi:hypothetical protein
MSLSRLFIGFSSGLIVGITVGSDPFSRAMVIELIAGVGDGSSRGRPEVWAAMSPDDLILISLVVAAGLAVYALLRHLLAGGGHLPTSSPGAVYESTDTTAPAVPTGDSSWRWARRIEADQRIGDAELRKKEAAAMSALDKDG